ncbi:STS14 protein [Nymphaea thermarum]|nr:STS14 protein [Nymphaea thermarum]
MARRFFTVSRLAATLLFLWSIPAMASKPGRSLVADLPPARRPSAASATNPNSTADYLEVHNLARAAVGVGPLQWSPALAAAASRFARLQRNYKHCELAGSTTTPYGENECWGKGRPMSAREAVETWVAQKAYYDYANNSCAGGHQCGVYTQVVWRKTARLGCGQASCDQGDITLTICYYDPPGNFQGERPY